MRGDAAEAELWQRALELVRQHKIESDADTGPLFDNPAPDSDAEVLKRLRQMKRGRRLGAAESAIADLPADLRWRSSRAPSRSSSWPRCIASSARRRADLGEAVREQRLRVFPVSLPTSKRSAARCPPLRARIPAFRSGRAVDVAEMVLEPLRTRAWRGRCRSDRCAADRTWWATSGSGADRRAGRGDRRAPRSLTSSHVLHRSERRLYLLTDRVRLAWCCPPPATAGADLFLTRTGSPRTSPACRRMLASGLTLKADGLHERRTLMAAASEGEIYAALGLPLIPPRSATATTRSPWLRAARCRCWSRARHPRRSHMHSDLERRPRHDRGDGGRVSRSATSDIAITDHSPHSAASRNLTLDGVKKQAERLRVREQYPAITILHGCEVDICPTASSISTRCSGSSTSCCLRCTSAGHGPDQR